jgi:ABC-type nitrate/sulfonate/bicarbonate transport system substrate-binding protein
MLVALLIVPNLLFAADTVKILAPKSTSSLPLLQLAADDPLPGIDIQTETFINHPQALALLLKGDVDFLFTGTSQGWNNYLDGGPMVMINTGVWGVSYLIGKDASIKTLADLKG